MISQYGEKIRLQQNQLYTVTLRIGGEETVVSFTSRYFPLFSTVRMIRSDYRDLLQGYTDDDINRRIHDNSKLAIELVTNSTNGVTIDDNYVDIPYAVKQFVRFKTEFDLATDLFFALSTKAGQEDKTLGDMRITKQVQTSALKDILALLEKKADLWETEIVGVRGGGTSSAIRAGSSPFGLTGRVSF